MYGSWSEVCSGVAGEVGGVQCVFGVRGFYSRDQVDRSTGIKHESRGRS